MAQIASPRSRRHPRLEIIPFIDIMFFLLATFMMVSLSMIQNEGVDLQLPSAQSSSPRPEGEAEESLVISIDKEGRIFAGEEPTSLEALTLRFRDIRAAKEEKPIVLQGDYEAQFGKIVEVFDRARLYGLNKLVIRTQKPAGAPESPNES